MAETLQRAVAIVGVGAVLPDAPDASTFWNNLESGRNSISDVQPDRWDPALYYDPDPKTPDRSYSKIGGWVREWTWDPLQWRMPIPPRVAEAMDRAQKWAIIGAREVLADYGYPERPLDPDRTAVIFGNAMAGDQHYMTALRVFFPEYARELGNSPSFTALPKSVQEAVTGELQERIRLRFPDINEDTMPGELANIIAGRVAAVFDFHGPNYVVDAACASAMAGMTAAIEGLENFDFDTVVTGGIDANMSASTFIKFCKIGALSGSGTRPYSEGADGFVMGEGAALFLLKRLEDAVRGDDKIYAVIRGFGGASDGKGKGITAPNPIGQRLAVERAWNRSGLVPVPGDLLEGHGTSTRVGDIVEVESMGEAFRGMGLPVHSIPLGSVKSNIGHLKGAAGAAGMLKAVLSLHHKMLPPSLGFDSPNPNIDWVKSPFYVNTELQPWEKNDRELRRAGVSAFGFGGTNFHMVLEEYVPGITEVTRNRTFSVGGEVDVDAPQATLKAPPRGALVLGADDRVALAGRLEEAAREAESGEVLPPVPPWASDLNAPVRVAVDYVDAEDLIKKVPKALKELKRERSAAWSASRAQGMFVDEGEPPKVAFLYTGQGSQYVNMLAEFRDVEPIVAETFAEADRIMTPLLGKPLTDYIFIDENDAEAMARASEDLRQTEITQPAVLTVDVALTRLLAAYGIIPDMVMGHSLGEYGALVGAGALSFADALEAVSARGQGMANVDVDDTGTMAAILGPLEEIEKIVDSIDGYVVVANINSSRQAVIGGATAAVDAAIEACREAGFRASELPVSHAFHTEIVAPAIDPLREVLGRLDIQSPTLPIIANISGDFYPMGPDVRDEVIRILGQQIASPVQFVAGLNRLYEAGARIFVEVGPKSALHGFVKDVLGDHDDSRALFTNHPKQGDLTSFNRGLCGLYAAGLGVGRVPEEEPRQLPAEAGAAMPGVAQTVPQLTAQSTPRVPTGSLAGSQFGADNYLQLGRIFADAIQEGIHLLSDGEPAAAREMLVISGASLGLPGTEHVFDDANVARILSGEQFIEAIPMEFRQAMVDKNITRLVKGPNGEARFEIIEDPSDAIKLAARGGILDLAEEYGFPEDRLPSLDTVTQLAIGAGIDALRDAGIPLVRHYKTTTKGTKLPDRWCLPDELQDDTGVIFASAFPGYDALLDEVERFHVHSARCQQLETLLGLKDQLADGTDTEDGLGQEIESQIKDLEALIEEDPYIFDRRFLFKVLAFGHAQFAQMIAARGPNTQVNAACASGGQALGLAEDWIRGGRCRRVIVISADNTTSDNLIKWIGAGFLASGAAATDENVEDAAIPFDRRRHGLIVGMGAAAMVIETASSVAERGLQPICEVLGTVVANSAFHGSRLDVHHIAKVMEAFVADAEARYGFDRRQIAPHTVFVSHETYTPARGGSAQAEATALQQVFGSVADQILVANTKGFTGHPMGVGIEEVVAVKMLETGIVPPVANHRELDPELGYLNLSSGGDYPIQYALRLAAGFGSQLAMSLLRWVPTSDGVRQSPYQLGHTYRITDQATWNQWLHRITGYASPQIELENRTLRVKDEGPPVVVAPPYSPAIAAHEAAAPVAALPGIPAAPAVAGEPPAPPTPPDTPVVSDPVEVKILELVTQQTGYPPDMLDMDLDLEADLGVDTVKQAEMFAAIREAYDIPRDDDLQLRDFPTLNDVVRFVYERRPDLGGPPEVPAAEAGAILDTLDVPAPMAVPELAAAPAVLDPVQVKILELVTEQTGYPPDMLDMDLDLEADLGVDTVKQAEMFAAIREAYDIPRDDELQLRDFPTLNDVVRFVYERRPDLLAADDVTDPVAVKVLELVAEKTGYPADMLEMDLDLEADLGIDTVKQAEMFVSIRAEWNIPRDDELQLRDFPTLNDVVRFVYERRPDVAEDLQEEADVPLEVEPEGDETSPAVEIEEHDGDAAGVLPADLKAAVQAAKDAVAEATAGVEGPDRGEIPGLVQGSMEAAESIPRRVPVPVLRPALDLCKETGVGFGPDSRVLIMSDLGGVGESLAIRLEKLGARVLTIEDTPTCEELEERLVGLLEDGPIQGVYWLPALDHEGDLGKLNPESWHAAVHLRVKLLYTAMRALYEQIGDVGTFLVSATRLGGLHGYDEQGAVAPLGGPVAGLTKTFKRERPDALIKVVDFEPSQKSAAEAEILIQETLRDPGAVEIGTKGNRRWTLTLEERDLADDEPGLELGPETVFVVTGAAGSIVSAITADLAKASGGIFYLLDLVPEPDIDDPEIDRVINDRENLKRDLFERIKARGERATPALVDRELAGLERSQSAAAAIRAVRDAGGEAHYHSVNLLDVDAVARVIDEVRGHSGRIDVLLHAAGLEISHMMPDKDPKEFNLVFDVKADGWFNLLHAIGDMPLGATVVFSSIAGRFGNAGQADYSAANDLLCKITSSFRTTRPETRGIAIDWTAWGGIGMATRGSIPLVMKEAGIDMLPPEAGVAVIRRELTTGDWRGEVVIAERLGILLDEWDETGGLDIEEGLIFQKAGSRGVMVGEVDGMGLYDGLTVETTLDPGEQPFLYDHQIEGTPVLPGVMGIEAFAEAARLPFPDLHVAAVEDVDFLAPFKFYRGEPRTVTVQAIYRAEGDDVIADCRLLGSRTLVGQEEPQVTTHFTGRVRLSTEAPTSPEGDVPAPPEGDPISATDIYKVYFHGPAYQVIEGAWRADDGLAGLWAEDLPENHSPMTLPTVMEPRLIEFCVQMSSLWDLGVNGRMGLPRHLDRVSRIHSLDEAEGGLYVVVHPDPESGFEAQVMDDTGKVYVTVSGYRTVELPVGIDPDLLRPLRDGMVPLGGSAADRADDTAFDFGSEVDEMPDPDEDGTW